MNGTCENSARDERHFPCRLWQFDSSARITTPPHKDARLQHGRRLWHRMAVVPARHYLLCEERGGSSSSNATSRTRDATSTGAEDHDHPDFNQMMRTARKLPPPREIFDSLDTNEDGTVSAKELDKALRKMGKSERVREILLQRVFSYQNPMPRRVKSTRPLGGVNFASESCEQLAGGGASAVEGRGGAAGRLAPSGRDDEGEQQFSKLFGGASRGPGTDGDGCTDDMIRDGPGAAPPRRLKSLRASGSEVTFAEFERYYESRKEELERVFTMLLEMEAVQGQQERHGTRAVSPSSSGGAASSTAVPRPASTATAASRRREGRTIDPADEATTSEHDEGKLPRSISPASQNTKRELSAKKLRELLALVGKTASDDEIRLILSISESEHGGKLSFTEFAHCCFFAPDVSPAAVFDNFEKDAYRDDAAAESTVPRDLAIADVAGNLDEVVRKLMCGMIAGATSRTVTAPIERTKLIMQSSMQTGGFLQTFSNIYRSGTMYDYFRGNGANCVKIAPETALKFLLFDFLKKVIASDGDNPSTMERFFAGGLAGALAGAVIYPLEISKTRLTLAPPKKYNGVIHCLQKVAFQEGVGALYRGLGASTLGIIPYAGIDLGVNSLLRDYYSLKYEELNEEPSITVMLSCGMISSTTAMTVTYPLNLVRTRMQMSGLKEVFTERVARGEHYTRLERIPDTAVGVFRHIVAESGPRGLYRGFFANLLKVAPATSVSYTVYGYLDHLFHNK
mmetsp:Transcript_28963/g.73214  ORF Transcript_28963/g.73214 Transcript_28963/m.73214 type:complete len:740 (-) Transcript_28963:288-2507(-)